MNGTCITSLGLALCNYPVKMYKDATKSLTCLMNFHRKEFLCMKISLPVLLTPYYMPMAEDYQKTRRSQVAYNGKIPPGYFPDNAFVCAYLVCVTHNIHNNTIICLQSTPRTMCWSVYKITRLPWGLRHCLFLFSQCSIESCCSLQLGIKLKSNQFISSIYL